MQGRSRSEITPVGTLWMRRPAQIERPSRDEFKSGLVDLTRPLSPQGFVLAVDTAIGDRLQACFLKGRAVDQGKKEKVPL